MKKLHRLMLAFVVMLTYAHTFAADWSNIPVPANAGAGNVWELQENVSDDFNYSFNSSSWSNFGSGNKWYNFYHNGWDGPGYTYWKNSNVSVDGSDLVITVGYTSENSKGGSYGVSSGCVTSNSKVVYPVYVESAISVANISLASCFWLLSPDDTEEIDIIENYGGVNGYKHLTHISHHSFVRSPFTDYQPRDWNSWYPDLQGRVSTSYGWGDWCWNNGGERRYMRMGVYWVSPKHFEYYIDGELVRVMYHNAIATNMNGTWQYTYFNSMNWNVNGYMLPTNNGYGYTDVTTYATSSSYNFATLQATSNASNGYNVIDPAWFQGGDTQDADGNGVTNEARGFTKEMDIIINMESQSWLAGSTPSYNDLIDPSKNQMKVDWVRVYKPVDDDDEVRVTGISITPASLSLEVGETGNVTGAVIPSNATVQTMTLTSSNESVATVTQGGVVTAVATGTATITAKSTDGGFTATITVTVSTDDDNTTGDIVIEAENFISTGGTYDDGYVSLGVNATASTINYVNSGDWATYSITNAASGVYSIAYSISTPMDNAEISLYVDDVLVSTDAVSNNGAWDNYTTLNASSSVELNGNHTVKFVASGSNAWQFNLNNISFTRTGDIEDTDIAVTGISITPATLSLEVGNTGNVTGAVIPDNATDQTMTFTSSSENVATVTQSGVVTAIAAGTATITAKSTDGGYTATSTITVTENNSEIITIEAENLVETSGTYNDGNVPYGANIVSGIGLNWVNNGDWATYNVTIPQDGAYQVIYYISSPITGSTISFSVNDVLSNTTTVPNNGGWDDYTALEASNTVNFTAGEHEIKITAGATTWAWNIDKITIQRVGEQKSAVLGTGNSELSDVIVYPIPASDAITIDGLSNGDYNVSICNLVGVICKTAIINSSLNTVSINDLPAGNYILMIKGEATNKVVRIVKQ